MEGWVDLVDLIAPRPGVELATFRSRVRRRTAAPPRQPVSKTLSLCFRFIETVFTDFSGTHNVSLHSFIKTTFRYLPAIVKVTRLPTCDHTFLSKPVTWWPWVSPQIYVMSPHATHRDSNLYINCNMLVMNQQTDGNIQCSRNSKWVLATWQQV